MAGSFTGESPEHNNVSVPQAHHVLELHHPDHRNEITVILCVYLWLLSF